MGKQKVYDIKKVKIVSPAGERINAPNDLRSWLDRDESMIDIDILDLLKRPGLKGTKIILPDKRLGKLVGGVSSSCNDGFTEDQAMEVFHENLIEHNLDFVLYSAENYRNKNPTQIKGALGEYIKLKIVYDTINGPVEKIF